MNLMVRFHGIAMAMLFVWLVSWCSVLNATDTLTFNSGFEIDENHDQWPDSWGRVDVGGSWEEEAGNHFLRLRSPEADVMVMLYQEVAIPDGVEAIEMTWKQRVTGLRRGDRSWFDARIIIEWMDGKRNKVSARTPVPHTGTDSNGWVEKRVAFLVPEESKILKLMPCLFRVAAGTFDIDDLKLVAIDAAELKEAAKRERIAREKDVAVAAAKRQQQAAKNLSDNGNLVSWGDYEKLAGKKNIGEDDGNHFLRLVSNQPGQMVMDYREVDIPVGVQALKLSWRQRVTGLRRGKKPWFDARIMMEWKDAAGKKLSTKPGASYTQKDTGGWVEKKTEFLVPAEAVSLVLMPCLFEVQAGTFEVDDLLLVPTDAAQLIAAKEEKQRIASERFVEAEEPVQEKWPKMLRVQGNRLIDSSENEIILQGVNAGGLETLPQDEQPVKSLVVAIDQWHANCVRIPLKDDFWFGKSPYQSDGGKAFREKIDKMITLAANRGAYVVIDLHRYRAPKQEHAEFWKDFAKKYKNHPAVLFDLLNEPHGISWEVWKNGGWVGDKVGNDESAFLTNEDQEKSQGFNSIGMQAMVDAVRETGAKNIVIVGGLDWAYDLSGVLKGFELQDPEGNGIMYSSHIYPWKSDWQGKVLDIAQRYPVFIGEVGADVKKMDFLPLNRQEDPYTWIPDMLGCIQTYKLNWTGWCFHPKATPVMITDWDYTPSPFWGAFAKEALEGKRFTMKKMR